MLPTKFEETVGALTHHVNRIIEQQQTLLDTTISLLKEATEEYVATSVAVLRPKLVWKYKAVSNGGKLSSYFRNLSTSLKRPFVMATEAEIHVHVRPGEHRTVPYVRLQLPNTTRVSNICAGLMLISQPCTKGYKGFNIVGPLGHEHTPNTHVFYFIGGEGRELFDAWLAECRTNPIYKIVLRS
jgi:hypothetical protein